MWKSQLGGPELLPQSLTQLLAMPPSPPMAIFVAREGMALLPGVQGNTWGLSYSFLHELHKVILWKNDHLSKAQVGM